MAAPGGALRIGNVFIIAGLQVAGFRAVQRRHKKYDQCTPIYDQNRRAVTGGHLRQNMGVKITTTVNNSNRPINIAKVQTQV